MAVCLRTVLGLGDLVDHLTLAIELVVAGRQVQTKGLQGRGGQVPGIVDEILVEIGDVVVRAVELDQLVTRLLDIVDIEVAVCLRTVLGFGDLVDHLTLTVELIVAGGQIQTKCLQGGGGLVHLLVHNELVSVGHIVVVAVVLVQAIGLHHSTVDVQIPVILGTIHDDHLTVRTELIITGENGSAVSPGCSVGVGNVQPLILKGITHTVEADSALEIVVIPIDILEA